MVANRWNSAGTEQALFRKCQADANVGQWTQRMDGTTGAVFISALFLPVSWFTTELCFTGGSTRSLLFLAPSSFHLGSCHGPAIVIPLYFRPVPPSFMVYHGTVTCSPFAVAEDQPNVDPSGCDNHSGK